MSLRRAAGNLGYLFSALFPARGLIGFQPIGSSDELPDEDAPATLPIGRGLQEFYAGQRVSTDWLSEDWKTGVIDEKLVGAIFDFIRDLETLTGIDGIFDALTSSAAGEASATDTGRGPSVEECPAPTSPGAGQPNRNALACAADGLRDWAHGLPCEAPNFWLDTADLLDPEK